MLFRSGLAQGANSSFNQPINPPAPTEPVQQAKAATRATDPDYGTCKQAKANHAGPYVRGKDPEYAYYQDRDGDGVVCE